MSDSKISMNEKINCENYEVFDNDHLEKLAILSQIEIQTLQSNTKSLQHNLKNILFVLKSRKRSSEDAD